VSCDEDQGWQPFACGVGWGRVDFWEVQGDQVVRVGGFEVVSLVNTEVVEFYFCLNCNWQQFVVI